MWWGNDTIRKWQSWNSNVSWLIPKPMLFTIITVSQRKHSWFSLSFGRWSWGPRKNSVFEMDSLCSHLGSSTCVCTLDKTLNISGSQLIIHKMERFMLLVELLWRLNVESMLMNTLCKPLLLWSRRGSVDMIILVLEVDKRCLTEMKYLV